jgi:hypothetical protein
LLSVLRLLSPAGFGNASPQPHPGPIVSQPLQTLASELGLMVEPFPLLDQVVILDIEVR